MKIRLLFIIMASPALFTLNAQINPLTDYGEIFRAVQEKGIFNDQKTFADCEPRFPVDTIKKRYEKQKDSPAFDLKTFVTDNFKTNLTDTSAIFNHINTLWSVLTRQAEKQDPLSSLIALPYPYIVPGGRFREIYYWDSYFTMLGLKEAGRDEIIENMTDNFAYLIDKFGHIPNGNRTYYLSRSQPPFFSLMTDLLAEDKGETVYLKYIAQLEKEYRYWMNGEERLGRNHPYFQRVVLLDNDGTLNRYWDNSDQPRAESYLQDMQLFEKSGRDTSVFRDIRAAAESGWDFSSRWLENDNDLGTIHTTGIIPVDLNCLLYHLEITLMNVYNTANNEDKALEYLKRAEKRKDLILRFCWDKSSGYFYDYDFIKGERTMKGSLAGLFPLYFSMADSEEAKAVLKVIKDQYLKEGGLVTTPVSSGQQWDSPNGWAPLQWIGYVACRNYGSDSLAHQIALRWTNLNIKVFFETGKMLEKYNVVDINTEGGGGEYKLQDGFGWTNGVFLKLWDEERKTGSGSEAIDLKKQTGL